MADTPTGRPPAKRIKCDYSKSFDVVVGPEGKKFSVYYDNVANQSDYFKAARSSQWNKDPQVPTDLSDTDPSTFQDYLKLVYTGEFDEPDTEIPRSTKDCSPAERDVILIASESYFQKLASLYVLADKLQDSTSANSVMDRLLIFSDASNFLIPAPTLAWVYEHTPQNSFLRKMVRDVYIYETREGNFDEGEPELPNELYREIARENRRLIIMNGKEKVQDVYRRRILDKWTKCHYHQHKHVISRVMCPGDKRR